MSSRMVGARSMALRFTSMCSRLRARHHEHQRHADERLPELEAVAVLLVLAERLAVVGASR